MHSALCPMASGWQVFVRFAMAGAAPCVSRGLSGVGRRGLAAGSWPPGACVLLDNWRFFFRLRTTGGSACIHLAVRSE